MFATEISDQQKSDLMKHEQEIQKINFFSQISNALKTKNYLKYLQRISDELDLRFIVLVLNRHVLNEKFNNTW